MAREERYAALVARLQVEVREKPWRYRVRLALLAGCGYAVLVLMLAFGLGVPLAVLARVALGGAWPGYQAAYLIVFPGVLGVLVLRALWIRFDAPAGWRLRPGEAPALEREIERLRIAAGAPPLRGIVIDGELNAAAASVPRALGLFGHRHYLVLGLPLLRLLDRAELAAVIGHEFGHFGEQHGRFGGWIHRVRLSWHRVLQALAGRDVSGAWLLAKFYAWYVPYFNAYSFALARHHEIGADAVAARVATAEDAASALIRIELAARRLRREFWPGLEARMRAQRLPAPIQAELARALADPACDDLGRLLAVAAVESDPEDTHPTLLQRLAVLQARPVLRVRAAASAADYLGALQPRIERQLDAHWRERIAPRWAAAYEAAHADRARLDHLESRREHTAPERLEYARLIETLRPDFDALPLYDGVIAATPGSAMAHYRAGVLRIRRGDWVRGVAQLQQAMALDPGAIRPVLADLEAFEQDAAVPAEAAAAMATLRADYATPAKSLDARDGVAPADELLSHDLDAAVLHALARTLAGEVRIARAWLARKRMDLAEEPPHYVLLLDWRGSVVSEAAALARIAAQLTLPGSHSVFTGTGQRKLAARVRAASGAPVYARRRG